MADEQDKASIELVRKIALQHSALTDGGCRCEQCVAVRRVCVLATEAVTMKAAKARKKGKLH